MRHHRRIVMVNAHCLMKIYFAALVLLALFPMLSRSQDKEEPEPKSGQTLLTPTLRLGEPEKMKSEEIRFKSAVAVFVALSPEMDPENKASLVLWIGRRK